MKEPMRFNPVEALRGLANDEHYRRSDSAKPTLLEAAGEFEKTLAELEAERAKVRELRAALIRAKNRAINVFNTGDIDVAEYEADLSISEIEQSLSNTSTAPTEAEIRKSERERLQSELEGVTNARDEYYRLHQENVAKLEAERAEKRRLMNLVKMGLSWVRLHTNDTDQMGLPTETQRQALAACERMEEFLCNGITAPTEAEIRADQIERIADWFDCDPDEIQTALREEDSSSIAREVRKFAYMLRDESIEKGSIVGNAHPGLYDEDCDDA